MWYELCQASSPCKPFVSCALRFVISTFDSSLIEHLADTLAAHVFFSSHTHEQIVDLLVELFRVCKDSVLDFVDLCSRTKEDRAAE